MTKATPDAVRTFFDSYPFRQAGKGQILVQAGDTPPGVFYLMSGQVKEYDISDKGELIVVNVFKQGAFFPMSWAINRTPNQYFFESITAIKYKLAPADAVVRFLHEQPAVAFDLLARVYSGTDGLLRRMAHMMGGTARTRLLFELTVQARRFGRQSKGDSYSLELSEQELAKRAGLSRETVNRMLSGHKNLITVSRGAIVIHSLAALEQELGSSL